ncbi:PIG-L deacetylase family protein [Mordavella massiliensis]|uniref:PIG-L family deacetylase n=1 Tax=Mordavella massiliensis TaxID=1871024 RepID=A0A939BHS6_9CLOT|nr:PIG-L deacetylase family protein [Mordavella massiliensis]MBM6949106.1 PIG-L family deacetylase [Mordavella massiliensis]
MNYLFVVAHPDDESDAAGGTINKLIKEGHNVAVAIMVKQAEARRGLSQTLATDEEEAMAILGVKKVYHADFPNIKMNIVPHLELVQFVEACIDDFQAEAIVTHHPTDTNNDHVMTSYAAQAASRLFQRKSVSYKLKLFMYMETPSATEWSLDSSARRFNPNYYVEIGKEGLNVKMKALEAYKGVMRTYPHPRSKEAYEGLAAYRGCQAGVKFAEAYEVVFEAH